MFVGLCKVAGRQVAVHNQAEFEQLFKPAQHRFLFMFSTLHIACKLAAVLTRALVGVAGLS